MYLKYGKYVIIMNCGIRKLCGGMAMKKGNVGIIAILGIVLAMIIEISIMLTTRRKLHIKSETVKYNRECTLNSIV